MFGMGFMEILLIAVIAIVALGPDKLPTAMVEIAKFIKKFKSGVDDAKTTLDSELNLKEMKEEAQMFKAQIENTKSSLNVKNHMDLGLDNIMNDDLPSSSKVQEDKEEPSKDEKVSFKKKKKKNKVQEEAVEELASIEESNEQIMQNAANKFKVNFPEDNDKNKDEKKEDNA
ncbi:Sec-independent protein translocase protein TatB [Arcobacter roscoffensis]|uniref:Sec-independent protein translocase protein TatB homolog n=1 Tax=Arcobacter roscoffensis TaxID=2961520 RepID=A0ABY5E3I1_9BACT|nr:Sec-independent protein translocase protein TatB [Arcobacter roscoffensis]UTJ05291.1 Sec-independent protein translocase protein TatB [Arcobacter roscoffensis]